MNDLKCTDEWKKMGIKLIFKILPGKWYYFCNKPVIYFVFIFVYVAQH